MFSYDQAKLAYVLIVVLGFIFFTGTTAYLYTLRSVDIVSKRDTKLIIIIAVLNFLMMITLLNNSAFVYPFINQHIPCWIRLVSVYAFMPMLVLASALQRTKILISYFNSQSLIRNDLKKYSRMKQLFFKIAKNFVDKEELRGSTSMVLSKGSAFRSNNVLNKSGTLQKSNVQLMDRGTAIKEDNGATFSRSSSKATIVLHLPNKFIYVSMTCQFLLSMVFLIITIFTSTRAKFSGDLLPVTGPCLEIDNIQFCYVNMVLIMLYNAYITILMKGMDDSLNIGTEVMFINISMYSLFLVYLLAQHSPDSFFTGVRATVGSFTFLMIMMFLLQAIRSFYVIYLVNNLRRMSKLLRIDEESFVKTLADADLFKELAEVIKHEMSTENTLFLQSCWKVYKKFNKEFTFNHRSIDMSHVDPTLIGSDTFHQNEFLVALKRINEKYIKPNSDYQLNIQSAYVKNIQNAIDSKKGGFEVLDPVKDEVLKMVFLNSFPRLVKQRRADK
jgi:hypothetical protein